MRMFWAVLAVILTFTLPMEAAHAKRFGGGKSFGRTYQTTPHGAPSPASPSRADSMPSRQSQSAPAPASPRKGMLGGLLGGLLAGGLLAALFAGGAFNGIQLMDVLMIAAAVFAIVFILRQLRGAGQGARPAYAGAGQPQARTSVPAYDEVASARDAAVPVFGQRAAESVAPSVAVPMNLPQGFDSPTFLEGAKSHYHTLQDAWNRNDLVKIREYCTPELYDLLRVERAGLAAEQHTEILRLDSQLVRADQAFGVADVSIRFSGRYRDVVDGVEEDFVDIWHLERDDSKDAAPWYLTGVESR